MRHGRRGILPAVAVLAVACLGAYQVWGQLDGTTVESRETLLAEAMPAGYGWNLVSELELEGYLIGGALDNEGQSALAVFEPTVWEGYRLREAVSYGADVARNHVRINETWYDIAWFGGAATEYAEITYTVDGEIQGPYRYDTTEMPVLCHPAPASSYTVSVTYYDGAGGQYGEPPAASVHP